MGTEAKITVEECGTLDVRALARAGYLAPGPDRRRLDLESGGHFVATVTVTREERGLELTYDIYSSPGAVTKERAFVEVVSTPAINHGERVWFSCPVCHRRVGKLYLPPGRTMFLCRHCHNLTYESRQKEPNIWRKAREEEPRLLKELNNPRLGLKRQLKAAQKLEKLTAQLESASLETAEMAPPELIDLLEDLGLWRRREPPRQASVPPSAPPMPAKGPRGRPRKKRAYHRRKPMHEDQRRTRTEAFCVKCRAYREPIEWKLVTFKNGRPAIQGRCPVCGTKVASIITARAAGLLAEAPDKPREGAELRDELLGLTPPFGDRW